MKKFEITPLCEQEKLILNMLCCDFSDSEVALKLNISVHTVKSHISKLKRLGFWREKFL